MQSSAIPRPSATPRDRLARILAYMADREALAIGTLGQLVATDTSFPPGDGYPAFADLLETIFAPFGFDFRRVTVPRALCGDDAAAGERVNLVASRHTGRPVCSLYFHTDTVPPGDGWTRPPLLLTREGRRLYGRGTADMKGAIAAVLLALSVARDEDLPLAYDPVLLFCTDEEGGLYPGIRYLAEQRMLDGHLLSFNGGAAPRIWGGCFGSFDLAVRITGRAAHSGDKRNGINAIEAAVPLLQALSALQRDVEQRCSALPPPPHYEHRPLNALLTVTAAHGGAKGSAVPARFELIVNRRYAPEERYEDALGELERVIATATADSPALGVETALLGHLAPVSDPTGSRWPRWQAALSLGFGFAPESFRRWGSATSSDMGWVQQAGIREILLGGLARPDNNVHAADEYTTIDDIVALAQSVLAYLAADFTPDISSRSGS